uniref:Ig-like domain-containing protein n=1 Tax=Oreochromis aureus TaxID=47969 RepID=A0AAZ1XUC5_OREAU
MAATLTFLLISSLLCCRVSEESQHHVKIIMPQNINVLRGSCLTIPCSFDVENKHEKNLDDSCKAYWWYSYSKNTRLFTAQEMTEDLTKKDCTTTFNPAHLRQRDKYYFSLECKYNISQTNDPPSPTLTPSTLEVKEGTSVSLTCSAPAPCWSHPPALTWTPNLGQSQETLQENQDKTKVKTSVMNFTASHLHHGNKISCTAVYQKQHGSPDVTAEKEESLSVSVYPASYPSGPVPENSNVSLTCSSNSNPAVRNYTWYRADGDQEAFIGTGTSLNIQVFRDRRSFFCKAENEIGVGCSSSIQIDVQCKYHISHLLYISSHCSVHCTTSDATSQVRLVRELVRSKSSGNRDTTDQQICAFTVFKREILHSYDALFHCQMCNLCSHVVSYKFPVIKCNYFYLFSTAKKM